MAIETFGGQQTAVEDFAQRFWSRVDIRGEDECWEWQGARLQKGYGQACWPLEWVKAGVVPVQRELSHRVALALGEAGNPFTKLFALHSCDNPPCCNPNHLRYGTVKDNSRDMVTRGRHVPVSLPGEINPKAKLTEADVRLIRSRRAAGERPTALAIEYGVSAMTIYRACKRANWKHVA